MKIDPSILYRIAYEPRRTMQDLAQRPHYQSILPVMAIALIYAGRGYVGMVREGSIGPIAGIIGLVVVFAFSALGMLIPPLVNALYVYFLRVRIGSEGIAFRPLLTAFIVCAFPLYLGILLSSISEVFWFGLGNAFRFLAETHGFLFLILATITPYFLWTVFLWWTAVSVLLRPGLYTRFFLVGSFVAFHILVVELLNRVMLGFIRLG